MPIKDRAQQARACRLHYERNKADYVARSKAYKRRQRIALRRFVREAKNVPCADCGLSYPHFVMDFDHRSGDKVANIADMAHGAATLKKIIAEMKKCDVVCSNCHRTRTWNRHVAKKVIAKPVERTLFD